MTNNAPVTGDPAFVNPAADDYRLTMPSVAGDAGVTTDLHRQARAAKVNARIG